MADAVHSPGVLDGIGAVLLDIRASILAALSECHEDRLTQEQQSVDRSFDSIQHIAHKFSFYRPRRIPVMHDIRCHACDTVMEVVRPHQWREVQAGELSPFCRDCSDNVNANAVAERG